MKYRPSWFGVLLLCGITLLLGIELISCQKDKAQIHISRTDNEIIVKNPEVIWIEINGVKYRLDCLIKTITEQHPIPTPEYMDRQAEKNGGLAVGAEIDISSDTETPGGEMEFQPDSIDIIDDPEVKPILNMPAMISLADDEVTVTVVHPEPTFIADMVWNLSKARWEFIVMRPELVLIYLDGKEINLAEWMRKVVICEIRDDSFEMERTDGKRPGWVEGMAKRK